MENLRSTSTATAPLENGDLRRRYTPDELDSLSDAELDEMWLTTADQPFYQDALTQVIKELHGAGLHTDVQSLAAIDQAWAYLCEPAPHFPLYRKDGETQFVTDLSRRVTAPIPAPPAPKSQPTAAPNIRTLAVVGAAALVLLCLAVGVIRRLASPRLTEAELTGTVIAATQTALIPATATPLAIDALDRTVGGGDNLRDRYPVTIELLTASGAGRVFPVQQRAVDIAEWQYDPSPDIATAIYGLVVRPVVGIPYSPENRDYLATLQAGDHITVGMSTGQTLSFLVTHTQRLQPQDQSIFEQRAPGIVVVLLGEPSSDRLVIYGLPTAEATLLTDTSVAAAPGQAISHGQDGLTITALAASTTVGLEANPLSPEWMYLLVDLRIHCGSSSLNTGDMLIYVSDASSNRYSPVTIDPTLTRQPPLAATLLAPDTDLDTSVAFLVPRGLADAVLVIGLPAAQPVTYDLAYVQPTSLDAADLDVLILGVETRGATEQPRTLTVNARLYNPYHQDIQLRATDVFVVYAPAALDDIFPVGPAQQPTAPQELPFTIRAGHAVDVEFTFAWSGDDPYVGLAIGGYRYVIRLR